MNGLASQENLTVKLSGGKQSTVLKFAKDQLTAAPTTDQDVSTLTTAIPGTVIDEGHNIRNRKQDDLIDFVFAQNSSVYCVQKNIIVHELQHKFYKAETDANPSNEILMYKSQRAEIFMGHLYFIDKDNVLVRVNIKASNESIQANQKLNVYDYKLQEDEVAKDVANICQDGNLAFVLFNSGEIA